MIRNDVSRLAALGLLLLGALSACRNECSAPLDGGDDPAAPGTWQEAAPTPERRFEGAAAALAGRIYFLGGITGVCGDDSTALTSAHVDVYDPASGSWAAGPPLPDGSARHHLAVAVLADKLYVLGGFTGTINGLEHFHPSAATFVLDGGQWRRLADQPLGRGAATAQVIGDEIFVAGGGRDEPDSLADLYIYRPASDSWRQGRPMPTAREHVASCQAGGQMLVLGGWHDGDKRVTAAVERYDPASDAWTRLPDLPTARGGLGAAVIAGRCYAVGGERWDGPAPGTFRSNEALDLTQPSASWQLARPLPTRRHGMGVAALGGALYTVGGGPIRANSYSDVVEVFTP